MTKGGLIEAVAESTPHISKKDTEIVVNTIFDSMARALQDGERIEIRGFGSFQVKVREAREGRNPKTGEPVQRVITGGCGVVFHGPSIMSMNVPRSRSK